MVLEVLANASQIYYYRDFKPAEQIGWTHTGQLQQLRRLDSAG